MKLNEIFDSFHVEDAADQGNSHVQYFPDDDQTTKILYARRSLVQAFKNPDLTKHIANCTTFDQMYQLAVDVLDRLPETSFLRDDEKKEVAEQFVRVYYRDR